MTSTTIDVHHHILPDFYRSAVAQSKAGFVSITTGFPSWTVDSSLSMMEKCAIETAVVSISTPGVHFGDDGAARELARQCNEYCRSLMRDHGRRFGAFAALPLPDVRSALAEMDYCLDTLKLDGICILTSYGEHFLGDPYFDPILEEANRRSAVVFIHPSFNRLNRPPSLAAPAFVSEYPLETTRAVTNMLYQRTLERYPNISFILSHAGGCAPYLAWRYLVASDIDTGLPQFGENALAQLRRFYFDTALSAGPATMAALNTVADPERILFGTDFPMGPLKVAERSSAELRPQFDKLGRNAKALFPRLAGAMV